MLKIIVPGVESYDDAKQEFVTVGDVEIELEHSLLSLSKWESVWEKPFLGTEKKTTEETLGYIQSMSAEEIPSEVFSRMTDDVLDQVNKYISAKMTASWVTENAKQTGVPEKVTAELIYYWMITLTIPFECENWHLNRLLMLIKVCNRKNAPEKKMSKADLAARNRELNAQRKAQLKTSG